MNNQVTIPGDLTNDGKINALDVLELLNNWGVREGYNTGMLITILNNWSN